MTDIPEPSFWRKLDLSNLPDADFLTEMESDCSPSAGNEPLPAKPIWPVALAGLLAAGFAVLGWTRNRKAVKSDPVTLVNE